MLQPSAQPTTGIMTTEAHEHVNAARLMLQKALHTLGKDACTAADTRTATGQTHSASRSLKRACEALTTRSTGA